MLAQLSSNSTRNISRSICHRYSFATLVRYISDKHCGDRLRGRGLDLPLDSPQSGHHQNFGPSQKPAGPEGDESTECATTQEIKVDDPHLSIVEAFPNVLGPIQLDWVLCTYNRLKLSMVTPPRSPRMSTLSKHKVHSSLNSTTRNTYNLNTIPKPSPPSPPCQYANHHDPTP